MTQPKFYNTKYGQRVIGDFKCGKLTHNNIPHWTYEYCGLPADNRWKEIHSFIKYFEKTGIEPQVKEG